MCHFSKINLASLFSSWRKSIAIHGVKETCTSNKITHAWSIYSYLFHACRGKKRERERKWTQKGENGICRLISEPWKSCPSNDTSTERSSKRSKASPKGEAKRSTETRVPSSRFPRFISSSRCSLFLDRRIVLPSFLSRLINYFKIYSLLLRESAI